MFDIVIVSKALLITLEEVLKGPGFCSYFLKNTGKVLELMKQMSGKIRKRLLESPFFCGNPKNFYISYWPTSTVFLINVVFQVYQ